MGNRVARLAYTDEATSAAWAVVGRQHLTDIPTAPHAEAALFTAVRDELRKQALGMPPGLTCAALAAAVRQMVHGAASNPIDAAVRGASA